MNIKLRYLALVICLLFVQGIRQSAYSQCPGGSNQPFLSFGCNSSNSTGVNQGDYLRFSVISGVSYNFNTGGTPYDDVMYLYQNGAGGSFVAAVNNAGCCGENLDWTANFTGTVGVADHFVTCSTWNALSAVLAYKQNTTINNTTNASAICNGTTKSLTYVLGGPHNNPGVSWSVVAGPGSGNISGSTFTATTPGSVTVRGTLGACFDDVTFTINAVSVAPNASASASVNPTCPGQSTTLSFSGGSLGAGAVWNWYSGSCNGTFVNSGASITVNPSVTTTYYVKAVGTCNTTACGSVTVTVHTLSSSTGASASPTAICVGQGSSTLSVSGTLGTDAASWRWYTGNCGVTPVTPGGIGQTISVSPSSTTPYYVRAEGSCANSACQVVVLTVNNLPAISFNQPAGGPYCASQTLPVALLAAPGGGTFSGNGVSGTNFIPSNAAVGNNVITYTYTDGNGCTNTATRTVVVTGLPSVSFTGLNPTYCVSQTTPVTLTSNHTSGPFSGPGINSLGNGTATFTPSTAGAGVHTITYSFTDGNGCVSTTSQSVQVVALPAVTFSSLASSYCTSNGPVQLVGFPSGGTFSGSGVTTGGLFSPSTGAGSYTITYSYTNGNGCTNTTSQTTTVNALPTVSYTGFNGPHQYCLNSGVVTLTGSPSGGTFSGPGVTAGGLFTPSTAGLGTHSIVYTYTNGNNCTNTATQSVQVLVNPTVTFSGFNGLSQYCVSQTAPVLLTGSPTGGTFTGPGITDLGNGTANFVPSVASTGTHSVTYTYTSGIGCVNSQTQTVEVVPLPSVTINNLAAAYCITNSTYLITAFPSGGTFSGPNISSAGVLSPSSTGTFTITYSYTNGNGCTNTASQTTVVNPLPTVNFTGFNVPHQYCANAPVVGPLNGFPSGGTFSGPGTTASGMFTAATAGVGTHAITYTYTDANGCTNSISQNVTVVAVPVVSFSGLAGDYCVNAFPVLLTGNQGSSGTFSGPGITNNGNGTAQFSPTAATVGGAYPIIFTFTNGNGCTATQTQYTVVHPQPVVAFSGLNAEYCIDATPSTLTGSHVPGGSFTGTGITDNGNGTATFDPAAAGDGGPYTITYAYTDGFGCANSINQLTLVNDTPTVSFTGLVDECIDQPVLILTGTPGGGVFSGPGVSGNVFYPSVAGVGTFGIMYTYSDGNGCEGAATDTIRIHNIPVVTQQPVDVQVCPGDDASFSVSAVGLGLTYQWQVNDGNGFVNVNNTGIYSGANTNTLSITGVPSSLDGYQFKAEITGATCNTVTASTTVTIVENPSPTINTQPADYAACAGDVAVFSVNASGTSLTYQWQVDDGTGFVNVTNGGVYTGATTNTLTVNPFNSGLDGNLYQVVVTGTINCTSNSVSNVAVLTETTSPNVITQPIAQSICAGDNAVFTAAATGTGLTYQWQENSGSGFANVNNGGIYSGATSSTLTVSGINAGMDGYLYQVIISGSICVNSSTTTPVAINITTAPALTLQPADVYVCPSDPASFSVNVQGTGITYQWQVNTGNGFVNILNGGVYSGATTSTLAVSGVLTNMAGFQYRAIVNGAFCSGTSTSQIATIFINGAPVITQDPTDMQFCIGDNAMFAVSATGTGLSYQWQVNNGSGWTDLVNGINYSGVYTSTLTVTAATLAMDGYLYRVVVSGSINCSGTATSASAVLTENPAPFISSQPADEYICNGGNAVFNVTANGTGLSYQWQENTGGGFVNVVDGGQYSGATTAALTVSGVNAGMDGYQYQVLINGTICTATATSVTVTLHSSTAPVVTLQPADLQLCPGDPAIFTVAASGSNLTYQWEEDAGSGFSAIADGGAYSGATTATLTVSPTSLAMDGYQYRVTISSTDCPNTSLSNTVVLNINTSPLVVSQPADVYACPLDPVVFSATASGNGLTYQWQENSGSGFTDLANSIIYSGVTTPTLSIVGAGPWMLGYQYRLVVSGSINCSSDAISSYAVLYINQAPLISAQPSDQNYCDGDVASFSVTAAGSLLTYQWQVDDGSGFVDVVDGGVYSGATTSTLGLTGIPLSMDGYQYRVIVAGSSNCTSTVTSTVAVLNEDPNPFVSSQPADQYVCPGDNAVFAVTASGTGLTYQWQEDSGSGFTVMADGGIYSGTATSTLTITGATGMDGYTYRALITGTICTGTSVTNTVTLHETNAPFISVQPVDQSVCDGDNVTLAVTASGSGLSYQWRVNTGSGFTNITDGSTYSGSTTATLTISATTLAMDGYQYAVAVSGVNCQNSSTSVTVTLNVGTGPNIVLGPSTQEICDGDNVSFTVTAQGNGLTYLWQENDGSGFNSISNGGIYSNANTPTLTITGADASMNGYQYQAIVAGSINCSVYSTSSSAVLLVNPLPVVSFSGLSAEYCEDAAGVTLTGSPFGGTFSGPGISGTTFTAAVAGVGGPHTILYEFTDVNGCYNSTTQTVTVNALPVVSFTGLAGPYCINDNTPVTLVGSPVGGTFSGPGISGNQFTPSASSLGTISITYTYTDGNTCTSFQTQTAVVNDIPVLTITGVNPAYCVDDNSPVTLVGTPSGGTFSGTGVSGGTWTASDAGVGTHTVTYDYTDINQCSNSTTISIVVNPLPVVDFTGLAATYCIDAAAVTLTGIPANGTFSGTGMNGDDFDPALAGLGTHVITYTYTDVNGCTNSQSYSTTVNALPQPVISPSSIAFCAGDYGILDGGSGYASYTWSTNANGQQAVVTASGQVTVTVTDLNGCINTSSAVAVIVNALPVVDLGPDTTICTQTSYTLDAGYPGSLYEWSTNEFTQSITVTNTGAYAVTVTDPNGCEGFDYAVVTVSQTLTPIVTSLGGSTTFCEGGSITLDAGQGYTTYLWSDGATSTQQITVTQPGFYSVFVTNAVGCDGFSNPVIVTVLQNPSPAISADGPLSFCPGEDVELNAGFGYVGYQWHPGNQPGQTLTVSTAGEYSVTVIGTNGCSATTDSVEVVLFPLPNPSITADGPLQFCEGEDVILTVGPGYASYLWTSGSTTPQITVTEGGQYGVIVLDMNGCIDSSLVATPVTVTVWDPQPSISVSGDTLTCNPAFASYQWYLNDTMVTVNGTSQTHITQYSGNYSVVVTDVNGCTGESSVIEHSHTGVETLDLNATMSLYPNPTHGVFTFSAEFDAYEDIRVELTNALGQLIIPVEDVYDVKSIKRDYNLNHLPDGVYMLMIRTDKGNVTKRIVKN